MKKKYFALVLLCTLFAYTLVCSAEWSEAPSLSIDVKNSTQESIVTAVINISDFKSMAALQFDVQYDSTILKYKDAENYSKVLVKDTPQISTAKNDTLIYLWMDEYAGTKGGVEGKAHTVIELTFEIIGKDKDTSTKIALNNFVFVDNKGEETLTNSNNKTSLSLKIDNKQGLIIVPSSEPASSENQSGKNAQSAVTSETKKTEQSGKNDQPAVTSEANKTEQSKEAAKPSESKTKEIDKSKNNSMAEKHKGNSGDVVEVNGKEKDSTNVFVIGIIAAIAIVLFVISIKSTQSDDR